MKTKIKEYQLFWIGVVSCVFLFYYTKNSYSYDTPSWQEFDYANIRLLQSHSVVKKHDGHSLYIALEISLKKGWKTYWQISGATGLSPVFRVIKKNNVKNIRVLWPKPTIEETDLGTDYVYKDNVIIPIIVKSENILKDIEGQLNIVMGFCKTLCIPQKMSFQFHFKIGQKELKTSFYQKIKNSLRKTATKIKYTDFIKQSIIDYRTKKVRFEFLKHFLHDAQNVLIFRNKKFSLGQKDKNNNFIYSYDLKSNIQSSRLYIISLNFFGEVTIL